MKNPLLTPILSIVVFAAFVPATAAYTFGNSLVTPLYGPAYRDYDQVNTAMQAPKDHKEYYGTPETGVKLLRNTRRDTMLQELEQRVINLQKLRNRSDVSPEYTRELRIYERVLRSAGNVNVVHYRTPAKPQYRLMWRDGKLVKEPVMTPQDIHDIVDNYEYNRSMLTSPNDICSKYTGARLATCRYQMRVSDRIQR